MRATDTVTKNEYDDGRIGYYCRAPKDRIEGHGFKAHNHQILRALAVCIREVDNDDRLILSISMSYLMTGDITVRVVCSSTTENEEIEKLKAVGT